MKLSRNQIVDAALAQLQEDGLDQFSLRRLSPRLGVQTPALYWHIGDKAELLSLMAGRLLLRAREAIPADLHWREWLLLFGRATRRVLLDCRDGARLCASSGTANLDAEVVGDMLAAPLVVAGLDRGRALSFQASVISLALGWALYEQREADGPFLSRMLNFEDSFEAGLQALVRGFPD